MTIRLLFLGELDIHAGALLPFLSKHGYDITVINTSHWMFPNKIYGTAIPVCNLYRKSKITFLFKGRLEWFRKAALYNFARNLNIVRNWLKQIIRQEETDVIYGSWGSQSLPEISLAQKFDIPVVYEFLTYPTNIVSFVEKIENFFNRGTINRMDGRVLSTQRILDYMRNVFGARHGRARCAVIFFRKLKG
jgi:hypothetical protein